MVVLSLFVLYVDNREFLWLQNTLFDTSRSSLPNYKGKNFLSGRCCVDKPRRQRASTAACIDSSMPRRAWTARARSSLLAALILIGFQLNVWNKVCGYHRLRMYVFCSTTLNSSLNVSQFNYKAPCVLKISTLRQRLSWTLNVITANTETVYTV